MAGTSPAMTKGGRLKGAIAYEHPVVLPHVSHLRQVPFLTSVKFPHSPQASPW
jgi:hypothetical protein